MSTRLGSYRRDLILALRMREVHGDRIGEIVAEVESHVADTGEEPSDAFGPPREYAASLTAEHGPNRRGRLIALIVGGALAGWLLASGVFAVITGDTVLGVPGWLALLAGIALGVPEILVATRSSSRVRDPRTGEDMLPGRRRVAAGLLAFQVALVAVVAVITVATR